MESIHRGDSSIARVTEPQHHEGKSMIEDRSTDNNSKCLHPQHIPRFIVYTPRLIIYNCSDNRHLAPIPVTRVPCQQLHHPRHSSTTQDKPLHSHIVTSHTSRYITAATTRSWIRSSFLAQRKSDSLCRLLYLEHPRSIYVHKIPSKGKTSIISPFGCADTEAPRYSIQKNKADAT
jgi:hypothetical protein